MLLIVLFQLGIIDILIRSQIFDMNKVFTSYISLLYSVQRNIEWSADFPLFGLVTTHAGIDIWSDLNPKYLRIPLPDYVYLIFSSPLPPNSLFNQVDTRY